MTTIATEQIYDTVREHYGQLARASDEEAASCCAPKASSCCSNSLYSSDKIAELPTSVTDLSLGCGDPVSLADIRAGDTVLDLGAGGGIDCFLAAKRVGQAGKVIGVDMTPEMLERARANAARLNADNVEFRHGFLENLPLEDASVEVVISNCVINLSPDKPQVFREMYRVMKAGGRVAVSDIVTNGAMNPLVAKSLEAWAGCVAGALDMKDYRAGLEAAGFVDVAIKAKEDGANQLLANLPMGIPFSAMITARKA